MVWITVEQKYDHSNDHDNLKQNYCQYDDIHMTRKPIGCIQLSQVWILLSPAITTLWQGANHSHPAHICLEFISYKTLTSFTLRCAEFTSIILLKKNMRTTNRGAFFFKLLLFTKEESKWFLWNFEIKFVIMFQ